MTIGTINSGVTKALGFRAAGISVGIKRHSGTGHPPLDLALIVSDTPRHRRGGIHDQPRAGRASPPVARSPAAVRRSGAGDHRQ